MVTPLGSGVTLFSDVLDEQMSMQEQPYAPFKDCKEWGLVKWLMQQTNQSGADEYFKLEIVSITHYMLERSYILPSQQTCEVTKLSFRTRMQCSKRWTFFPWGPYGTAISSRSLVTNKDQKENHSPRRWTSGNVTPSNTSLT